MGNFSDHDENRIFFTIFWACLNGSHGFDANPMLKGFKNSGLGWSGSKNLGGFVCNFHWWQKQWP